MYADAKLDSSENYSTLKNLLEQNVRSKPVAWTIPEQDKHNEKHLQTLYDKNLDQAKLYTPSFTQSKIFRIINLIDDFTETCTTVVQFELLREKVKSEATVFALKVPHLQNGWVDAAVLVQNIY